MNKYYYLVAGLPELTLEDSKLNYTVADFKTEIYPGLSTSDQKLMDLFYLKFDNTNVLKLLKDKDVIIDMRGNFSAEELNEYIATIKEGGEVSAKEFPSYLSTFISDYFSMPAESAVLLEDHLAALYYAYAMKCETTLVAYWFEFHQSVRMLWVIRRYVRHCVLREPVISDYRVRWNVLNNYLKSVRSQSLSNVKRNWIHCVGIG